MTTAGAGEFVRKIETAQTGGGIMCDMIELNDGTILVISDELIALYANADDWEAGITVDGPTGEAVSNCILRPQNYEADAG